MSEFTSLKNTFNDIKLNSNTSSLISDIKETLESNQEYKKRLSKVIKNDEDLAKASPWLYKVFQDWNKCSKCTSLASCPKGGLILDLRKVGNYYDTKLCICPRKQKAMHYIKNIVHVDCYPYNLFISLKRIKEHTTLDLFVKTVSIINMSMSFKQHIIFTISNEQDRKYLAKYATLQSLLNNKKTSYIDAMQTFDFTVENNLDNIINDFENSDLIIIDNFDKSSFTFLFVRDFLPKLLQEATQHTLLIFANGPFQNLIGNNKISAQTNAFLKRFKRFEITEQDK